MSASKQMRRLIGTTVMLWLGAAGLATATPYVFVSTWDDWNRAMSSGHIMPVNAPMWNEYMLEWATFLEEGAPHPDTDFYPPEPPTGGLYVWEGGGSGGTSPSDAGLVMTWGPSPGGAIASSQGVMPQSSAWGYNYGLDPDLSNTLITITVTAPQFDMNGNQITSVSFGIQDVNGLTRAWYWNAGLFGPVVWNVPTTITINTSLTGLAAATPPATGYMNNPGFNITMAQLFIVDESGIWVGGPTPIPPPGTPIPRMWNYWHNLIVSPQGGQPTQHGPVSFSINGPVQGLPGFDGLPIPGSPLFVPPWMPPPPPGTGPYPSLRSPPAPQGIGIATARVGDVNDYLTAGAASEAEIFQSEPDLGFAGPPNGTNNQILQAVALGLPPGASNVDAYTFGQDFFNIGADIVGGEPVWDEPWEGRAQAPGFFEPAVGGGGQPIMFYFSVDPWAIGLPGTSVLNEATLQGILTLPVGPLGSADVGAGTGLWRSDGEASGDVFFAAPMNAPGMNFLDHDEAMMALLAPRSAGTPVDMEDDLDALEHVGDNLLADGTMAESGNTHNRVAPTSGVNGGVHPPDLGNPNNPNHDPVNVNPIIFSVDRGTYGAPGSAVNAQVNNPNDGASGDLFIAVTLLGGPIPGFTTNMLLIDDGQLGLMPHDDLDAVIVRLLIDPADLAGRINQATTNFNPNGDSIGLGFTRPLLGAGEAVVGFSVDIGSIGLLFTAVDFECRVDGMGLAGPAWAGSGVMEHAGDIFFSDLMPPTGQLATDAGTGLPFGQNYLWFEESAIGLDRGTWTFIVPPGPSGNLADAPDELNALDSIAFIEDQEQPEACCLPDGTCADLLPTDCVNQGGAPQGPGSACTATEACCMPAGVAACMDLDPLCCVDMGGTPQGAGTVCTTPQACCMPDGTCQMIDPLCCDDLGGTPQSAGATCSAVTAPCCMPDGSCQDLDPLCCDELGGTPSPIGAPTCLGDGNGDTIDDACQVIQQPQACCLPDGTCADLTHDACVARGGDPQGPGTDCTTGTVVCRPLKWAQPPLFNSASPHPECFWGWDEVSVFGSPQIVADDWLCETPQPITDVHWWGSYLDWEGISPPSNAPDLFHIGIWTDVPAGVDTPWSHPGYMIWQWVVPRAELRERPVACDFHPDYMANPDGCFRYDYLIPESEWFHQDPASTVFWISISAMYPTSDPGPNAWGWKTRMHYFNDDAIRILLPTDPAIGAQFFDGFPIEDLSGQSWDMAFVLTTAPPKEGCCLYDGTCANLPPADCLNLGGVPQGPGSLCTAPEACCLPAGTIGCIEVDPLCCVDMGGTPQGPGSACEVFETTCTDGADNDCDGCIDGADSDCGGTETACGDGVDNDCDQLVDCNDPDCAQSAACEACCQPQISCFEATPADCAAAGGTPQGAGSDCLGPVACCMPSGACEFVDELCCDDLGGTSQGAGSTCTPNLCAVPFQACCLPSGTCADLTHNDCVAQGGDPQGAGTDCTTGTVVCNPLKWAQPPTFNPQSPHPECFWGWDEYSVYGTQQIVADDWLCEDPRPITDIHWWGSYIGWEGIDPPPGGPDLFHIALWTDVPAGFDTPWSHPGDVIWQWMVPREQLRERPVACDFHPGFMSSPDGCFRYDFLIPEAEWFYQQPASTIYWISISAVHTTGDVGPFPWGWKTREHFFNDDAVRVVWPTTPEPGMTFVEGFPIEEPQGVSWDMAFVLTSQPCSPVDAPTPELTEDRNGALVVSTKNRAISFTPGSPGKRTALRVTLTNLPAPFNIWNGRQMWVDEPFDVSEFPGLSDATPPTFRAAGMTCDPVCRDWGAEGLIHVDSEAIVPGAQYTVQAIHCDCDFADEADYSVPLNISTSRFGDLVGPYLLPLTKWAAPDGTVDVATDVVAVLDKFAYKPGSPKKARADLEPSCIDHKINITDAVLVLDAFSGGLYPYAPSGPDPCNSPCP